MKNLQYLIRICQESHNTVTNYNYILCVVQIFMKQTLIRINSPGSTFVAICIHMVLERWMNDGFDSYLVSAAVFFFEVAHPRL